MYDSNGNLTRKYTKTAGEGYTDETYKYDENGVLIETTYKYNTSSSADYLFETRITTHSYDSKGQLIKDTVQRYKDKSDPKLEKTYETTYGYGWVYCPDYRQS